MVSVSVFKKRMRKYNLFVFLLSGFLMSAVARAQLDSSSIFLLNGPRTASPAADSGRYTIRPKSESGRDIRISGGKKNKESPDAEAAPVPAQEAPLVATDSAAPKEAKEAVVPKPDFPAASAKNETAQPTLAKIPGAEPAVAPVVPASPSPLPPSAAAAKDSQRRLNILELSVAPGYVYNNSDSSYSYRSYSTGAPMAELETHVWLNPLLAISGSYAATLSGSVRDSSDGTKFVPASQEWLSVGLRMRKFFGPDTVAPVLTFGFDYYDYEFRVPVDSRLREKLSSYGIKASFEAEMPIAPGRAWTIGVNFVPKIRHSESPTGIDFKSGENVDANQVGASIGERMQFERKDAIFWRLAFWVEKDLFSGEANLTDSSSGVKPVGVSVTNSFTVLQIGYRWGE